MKQRSAHILAWIALAQVALALAVLFSTGCGREERRPSPKLLEKYARHPLLAVSLTGKNRITLLGFDGGEREIQTIPLACKGPFGLAFAHGRDWLYATCWDHSQIVLVDLRNEGPPNIFTGARLPAWIRQRDGADETWISNEGAGRVTIYRSGTAMVLGEIATGAGPSDIVFTDSERKAWVSNETSGSVSLIDAEHRRRVRDIAVGKVPQGMALTSTKDRLLVANFGSDTVTVIDTASGREQTQIPVCQGPVGVAGSLEGESELAYVTCFKSGSVGVIDVNQRREIQRIAVGEKPLGIAAYPGGGRVYVCLSGAKALAVIQTGKAGRSMRRIQLQDSPSQIMIER